MLIDNDAPKKKTEQRRHGDGDFRGYLSEAATATGSRNLSLPAIQILAQITMMTGCATTTPVVNMGGFQMPLY